MTIKPFFGTRSVDPNLREAGEILAYRSKEDQLAIVRVWLNEIINNRDLLEKIADLVGRALLGDKYASIRALMARLFKTKEKPNPTPCEVAHMIRRRLKMKATMRPLLIRLAQKEKDRLRKREARKRGINDI